MAGKKSKKKRSKHAVATKEDDMEQENQDEEMENGDIEESGEGDDLEKQVYLPGDPMDDDEELTYDRSAYNMYHAAQTGEPCLSFDVIKDILGNNRTEYPMTCYIVCGTQSATPANNKVIVTKMTNLTKTESESGSENSYVEDEADGGPKMQTYSIKHLGGINRIRQCQVGNRNLVATWGEMLPINSGSVNIWDVTDLMKSLDTSGVSDHQEAPEGTKALFSFAGHQDKGYAVDWSPTVAGRLATGSCNGNMHLWQPREGASWHVDQRPLTSHTDSVEDIQWSPNEQNVLASCSVDQTIRIWDSRAVGSKACMLTCKAHDADVNVISWNRNDPFIVSGGDDGVMKVWDLRKFQQGTPVANFKHHTEPITSVEWHPEDSAVLAASGADNQITLWDLAVEKDDEMEAEQGEGDKKDLPPQLLFIHMGQTEIKELHWHPQLPGVVISTAASGFNIFKTISV